MGDQRSTVLKDIDAAWQVVVNSSQCLDFICDADAANNAMGRMKRETLDGYDYFHIECALRNGIRNFITDDTDFASADDITVFTSNPKTIQQARFAGKLVVAR